MAQPAPRTNFYVNYGEVTTTGNTDVLAPVFIAPRYEIHDSIYNDNRLVTSGGELITYSGASITQAIPWPSYEGGKIDLTTTKLYAEGATVVLGNGGTSKTDTAAISGVTIISSSIVDFGSGAAIAGADTILTLGYSLRVGDSLRLSSGSAAPVDAQVIGLERETLAGACEIKPAVSGGAATFAHNMSSFTGHTDTVYLMTVTNITVPEDMTLTSGAIISARVGGIQGDTDYTSAVSFIAGGSATTIGNYHLELSLTDAGVSSIDSANVAYQIYCSPSGTGSITKAEIATQIAFTPDTVEVLTKNLVTTPQALTADSWEADAEDGLAIKADAKMRYLGATLKIAACNDFRIYYRELLADEANVLHAGSEVALGKRAGPAVPENPLGMVLAAGAKSGATNFYLMSVEDDTDEAYGKALTSAARIESVYALLPLRQTEEVIARAEALLNYYSASAIAQVKRLWLYNQIEPRKAVLESTAQDPVMATVTSGSLVLISGSFAKTGIKKGSQMVFKNAYIDGELVPEITFTVTAKTSDTTATVAETWINITSPTYVTGYNVLTASEYAEAVGAKAKSYDNHRINYIFAESNTVAGYSFDDARYITAVLAAMRSATAPHAPLTDLTIPGTSIADSIGFTETDYETMNDAGVWICYRNRRNEVVSRHAITTGKVGTIAEEDAAVSNGDNILRFVRNAVSFLNGSCNVSPALINKLTVNVIGALDRIISRVYPDIIGPQILSIDGVTIVQDPNNSAGVIGTIDLDLPAPYLEGNFTFNLF